MRNSVTAGKLYSDDMPAGAAKKPREEKPAPDTPAFEDAMAELEGILDKMSGGDATLDESIALYARAAELIKTCGETLRSAKIRVDEITGRIQEGDAAEGFDDV